MESYSHIQLTEEEIDEAIIWAKRKKEEEMRIESIRKKEAMNRSEQYNLFNFAILQTFMINRGKELFGDKFIVDENNEDVFNLLCSYFAKDEKFENYANQFQVQSPSIEKGLLLAGNVGTGKTWLMRVFQKNARQTYWIRSAKTIAQDYLNSLDKKIPDEYLTLFKNPVNDDSVFYQQVSGLCVDDLGAENKKNNYGNVINVIGDMIEERYSKMFTGIFLHATTNLSADELKTFYGERVTSRMREIFNFIELSGPDRRK